MADPVSNPSNEGEEKNNEVGKSGFNRNPEGSENENREPNQIEHNKLPVAPPVSKQGAKPLLKTGHVFLTKVKTLDGETEEVNREDGSRFVLPTDAGP